MGVKDVRQGWSDAPPTTGKAFLGVSACAERFFVSENPQRRRLERARCGKRTTPGNHPDPARWCGRCLPFSPESRKAGVPCGGAGVGGPASKSTIRVVVGAGVARLRPPSRRMEPAIRASSARWGQVPLIPRRLRLGKKWRQRWSRRFFFLWLYTAGMDGALNFIKPSGGGRDGETLGGAGGVKVRSSGGAPRAGSPALPMAGDHNPRRKLHTNARHDCVADLLRSAGTGR